MGAQVLQFTANFVHEVCCSCGVSFYVTQEFHRARRVDGVSFYCPNGHRQHYAESETQRLQKQLEQERQRREWAEKAREHARERLAREEHRSRALKGHLTRTKRRVGNGVCPCCQRTFKDVQRHMASKHPHYADAGE